MSTGFFGILSFAIVCVLLFMMINSPGRGERITLTQFEDAIVETGKAVVAASVSTIFGFGSIMFSHYPGLVSTGKVAILGAVTTCLVAITLVPAVLTWRYEGRRKKGIPPDQAAA